MNTKERRKQVIAYQPYIKMSRRERNYLFAIKILGYLPTDLPKKETLALSSDEIIEWQKQGRRVHIPDFTGTLDGAMLGLRYALPNLTLAQRDQLEILLGAHNGMFTLDELIRISPDMIGQALLLVHGVEV